MRLYLLSGTLTLKNGKIDKYIFDGGYAQASATSSTSDNFTFYYYTPDHLGNIREVVDAGGNVQQVTNYYPFGATYAESTAADFQPYKYNGKELNKMHGLNTYDYGARQHDPILARWDRIDPLAEKYRGISPYVYCTNNPIKLLDQQGKEPTPYEAALMAKHVYGDKVNLAGGWYLSKTQYKSFNTESGLQSALYERTAKGVKEYAYVTAGTQDITDAKEDINQLFGVGTQYRESVNNAKILSNNLVNSELTFVGHSSGGGLAAANALATDRNAITINAAAISKSTKDNLQLPSSTSKGRIFNIVVKGEIVGYLQTKLGMKLEGGAYTLNAIYLPGNSIINTVLRINNHLIDTVIRKIEGERK